MPETDVGPVAMKSARHFGTLNERVSGARRDIAAAVERFEGIARNEKGLRSALLALGDFDRHFLKIEAQLQEASRVMATHANKLEATGSATAAKVRGGGSETGGGGAGFSQFP